MRPQRRPVTPGVLLLSGIEASDVLLLSGIAASDVLLLSGIASSDVPLLSGIAAGCHLIPLSYLLPRFSVLSSCSYSKIKFSSSSLVKIYIYKNPHTHTQKKNANSPFSRNPKKLLSTFSFKRELLAFLWVSC